MGDEQVAYTNPYNLASCRLLFSAVLVTHPMQGVFYVGSFTELCWIIFCFIVELWVRSFGMIQIKIYDANVTIIFD